MALSKIVLVAGSVNITTHLDPQKALSRVLEKQLPVRGCLRLWGKEAYVDNISGLDDIDMDMGLEEVPAGTVALWPDGRALSLFFGTTPVCVDDRIITAGRVFPIGRVIDEDINLFSRLKDGETVEIRFQKE